MSVKLYISEGQKRAELEAPRLNHMQMLNVIDGLFRFFDVEVPQQARCFEATLAENGPTIDIPFDSIEEEPNGQAVQPNSEDVTPDEPVSTTFKSGYVNGTYTLTQSVGEKLRAVLGLNAEEMEGGAILMDGQKNPLSQQDTVNGPVLKSELPEISLAEKHPAKREINGVTHYQTYVYCKNAACGQRRKTFVPEKQVSVNCPACNTKHARRDAAKDGFPNQDRFGNYFKADQILDGKSQDA